MWNPFRRSVAAHPVPVPAEPPIQALDDIDIAGKRMDGGVDLIIVASQPLDDSPQTLESIRQKVRTYLETIGMDAFQEEMGHPDLETISVIIVCAHRIHPKAHAVIEECRKLAAKEGVLLELRSSMG